VEDGFHRLKATDAYEHPYDGIILGRRAMTRKLIALTTAVCIAFLPVLAGCGGGGGNPEGKSDEQVQEEIQALYKKAQAEKGKGVSPPPK
jgi:hypothetical protein